MTTTSPDQRSEDPDIDAMSARLWELLDARLAAADQELADNFPGERSGRQPIHTVYVPADRYDADLVPRYGTAALAAMDDHPEGFAGVVRSLDITRRVRTKLTSEPVEDLRIDFEDGYVGRSDVDETADAERTARALAESQARGAASPFSGIRIKCFEAGTRGRAMRTLTRFLATLRECDGRVEHWVVTLPKVTSVDQVEAMAEVCAELQLSLGMQSDSLRFEVQVETPQSILGPDGTALVARMVHTGGARLTGLHYGTYDYSAFCGISAEQQSLEHPVADHAKLVMQAAVAGTGVRLSDGSTNILPVGDEDDVDAAWVNHHRLVRRSLERGYYQGWDLHPAQLPTRYAATYAFYREGLPRACERLADNVARTVGRVADEPATARALAGFVLRGLDCGAVDALRGCRSGR